jgi:hypothetical protein
MKYYMVVSQEEMYVELYYRKGQDWILKQFEEAEDTIILADFNLKIELSEVYHRVKFGEQKTDESSML